MFDFGIVTVASRVGDHARVYRIRTLTTGLEEGGGQGGEGG